MALEEWKLRLTSAKVEVEVEACTTCLDGWVGVWVALEEWKLRLTSVEVEAELGTTPASACIHH